MDRTVLHLDADCFYASCEMVYNPYYRTVPMAVGGDQEQRHGIILAKNYLAKAYGVKTGQAIWEAKKACPALECVPANGKRYQRFSEYINNIYREYTPHVEMGGLDESYIDVTGEDGAAVAREIRARVEAELGVTISAGISYNKIFAKLGSDANKPNGQYVITRENYRETVWPLPASDLLMVGPKTTEKFLRMGIRTIGDIARAEPDWLRARLGRNGLMLHAFANGYENSPVRETVFVRPPKSISNSRTTPRDLADEVDVKVELYGLAESVAMQMREKHLLARTVVISVRDNALSTQTRQVKLSRPSQLAGEFVEAGMRLFGSSYDFRHDKPIRTLGICAKDFLPDNLDMQLSFLPDAQKRETMETMEHVMDDLRRRFGYSIIHPGYKFLRPDLNGHDAREHNPMTPAVVSYGV